jgi:hypothetical protein
VLFVKPRYWVVVDDLQGGAEHRVELRFQFAPVDVALGADGWARAVTRGRGLLLRPFAATPLEAVLRQGSHEPLEGWVSPDYGQRRPAPVVVYAATVRLPLRLVTLMLPLEHPSEPAPEVQVLDGVGTAPAGLAFDADRVWEGTDGVWMAAGPAGRAHGQGPR